MTTLDSSSSGRGGASSSRPDVASRGIDASEVLARADGVQMIGEMEGSGYRTPPALARRADGQVVQLTPLLYTVLGAIDGARTEAEVAHVVSAETGQDVTAENVRTLVDANLRPAGLVKQRDGSEPELKKSQPLLGLTFKFAVTDPNKTRRLTAPFARLFNPLIVLAVLSGFAVMCWWVLFVKGLASATHEAFAKPGLLMLVFLVTVLSAGFHEFGHAAAARRGGASPGTMGAGVYLVWPAFYTDVTDSYRLGRGGRLRTDLGGLYFNAIVALATTGVWWATGYDAWLLVVATQILQMIRQLTPLVRFDGYHVLADLTGVPDLFHRIKPTLLGMLPWRWKDPEAAALKPWARAVVTIWVALVVPLLLITLWTLVIALPRILGTAWAGLGKQQDLMAAALADDDLTEVLTRPLAMVALAFPVFAIIVIFARLAWRIVRSSWQRTKGKPFGRAGAVLLGAALVAGLATAWWPQDDRYRPIMAYERGTLVDAVTTIPLGRPASTGLTSTSTGSIVTAWADEDPRPTRERPQLALILVPRDGGTSADSWVFPFNKPLQPGDGDNQALAVNTKDGSIQYDVAFALVWVEDDSPALQRNESYAFASCTGCAAVSVAFQVVLVTGDNHVAAPQNIAAAVNYDCVGCLTFALATQLFVTLDGPLTEGGREELSRLWEEIADFGANIADVPLSEIQARLNAYEDQILQIIEKEQGPLTSSTPTPSPSPGGTTPSPGTDSATPATEGSTADPTGEGAATPSQDPTGDATPTPTEEPTATAPTP
jgi:putative peptide zinc metalloprotease protein